MYYYIQLNNKLQNTVVMNIISSSPNTDYRGRINSLMYHLLVALHQV